MVGKLSLEIQLNFWKKIKAEIDSKVQKVQDNIDYKIKAETAKENLILIAQFQNQFTIKNSDDLIAQLQNPRFREYLEDENTKPKIVAYLCDILNEEFGGNDIGDQIECVNGFVKDPFNNRVIMNPNNTESVENKIARHKRRDVFFAQIRQIQGSSSIVIL